MGNTRSKWESRQLAFYDGTTFETVKPLAPIVMLDDFFGTVTNTDIWTVINVGAGSTGQAISNLTFTQNVGAATDENGIYQKDDKAWNIDKGFIFECRAKLTVAPTLGSEFVMAVQNDNLAAGANRMFVADEIDVFAAFGFYTTVGAGLVAQIRTDDNSVNIGVVTTGVTSVVGTYQVFRIDFTDVTDVKFFIDGVGVATSTTFVMSNGTNVMFQPYVATQKVGANAGLGTVAVDYVRMWQPTR